MEEDSQSCFFLRLDSSELARSNKALLVRLLETNGFVVKQPSSNLDLLLLALHRHDAQPCDDHVTVFATERALHHVTFSPAMFRSSGGGAVAAESTNSLLLFLQRSGLVIECGPLHKAAMRREVWAALWRAPWSLPSAPLRSYFGEEVAFYFEWMNLYSNWLLLPGFLSFLLWIYDIAAAHYGVDRSPWVPFYSFLLVLWSFLFHKLWERRSNSLAFGWGTWNQGGAAGSVLVEVRPSFRGTPRISPVTGAPELHYPRWRRRVQYAVSAILTGAMLAVAFFVMICSLNLQGYVDEKTRFGDDNPFFMGPLQHLSRPGAIFDLQGPAYRSYLPCILHSVTILILNQMIYKQIALALTEWENHRTEEDFENSLIIKRFLFDAFDSYIALFYLAFYECDVVELRSALVGLYTTDSVRRLLVETVVPLVLFEVRGKKSEMGRYMATIGKKKKTDEAEKEGEAEAIRDLIEEPYEIFDDYLEMVIQFGYICLFASAFPLAACLSIATNWLEVRSDAFKLAKVYRRPSVRRPHGIGIWKTIIASISWVAILTNVFIFAFSSEQMMQWFPLFFKHVKLSADGQTVMEQELRDGAGRYVLGLIFVLEHLLILIALFIEKAIDSIPIETRNKLLAAEYQKEKLFQDRQKK